MSILFLSTIILSYSQDSYPKKLSIDNRIIIAITESQLKKINTYLLEYEHLSLYKDSLMSLMAIQELSIEKQINTNRLLNKRNSELLIENADLYKINDTNKKLREYYEKELKVKNRKKTIAFFGGVAVGITTTSFLILMIK